MNSARELALCYYPGDWVRTIAGYCVGGDDADDAHDAHPMTISFLQDCPMRSYLQATQEEYESQHDLIPRSQTQLANS